MSTLRKKSERIISCVNTEVPSHRCNGQGFTSDGRGISEAVAPHLLSYPPPFPVPQLKIKSHPSSCGNSPHLTCKFPREGTAAGERRGNSCPAPRSRGSAGLRGARLPAGPAAGSGSRGCCPPLGPLGAARRVPAGRGGGRPRGPAGPGRGKRHRQTPPHRSGREAARPGAPHRRPPPAPPGPRAAAPAARGGRAGGAGPAGPAHGPDGPPLGSHSTHTPHAPPPKGSCSFRTAPLGPTHFAGALESHSLPGMLLIPRQPWDSARPTASWGAHGIPGIP